ncbi:MAG: tRNA (guanosine(46)-N7)-methyltransferase TrmB [Bacteroidales bacterium]|nr:tRNA (guanosine(46)-N7)-methyltransferase TrmB [Bacteroidales bacterium]
MSSKDKLRKFRENETFGCLFQPKTEEVLGKPYSMRGKWGKEVFGNNNPITLELGCGKGEYTIALAQKFPDRNFIGIDIKGARLWKGAKFATENKMKNVLFIRTRIEFITSLFDAGEISEIWITFPDPQLKRPRKRLTGTMFLERYKQFLPENGIINLKTDSKYLHNYTLALAQQNSLDILEANNDIYGSGRADEILSIKTFYEAHYIKRGLEITYLAFMPDNTAPLIEPQWDEEYWEVEEAKGRENTPANKG